MPVYRMSVVLIRARQYRSHLVVRMEGRGLDLRGSSTHSFKKVQTVSQLLHTLLEFEAVLSGTAIVPPLGQCSPTELLLLLDTKLCVQNPNFHSLGWGSGNVCNQ